MKPSILTRRKFMITGAAAGIGGAAWLGVSSSWGARFVRQRFEEIGRDITPAPHKPTPNAWSDNAVTLAWLRSTLDTVTREHRRERVLVVAHQVIVNCYRYLLERMDEERILAIDRESDVPNCSVTSYAFDPSAGRHGKLVLDLVNFTAPLEAEGAPVTVGKDQPAAPRA